MKKERMIIGAMALALISVSGLNAKMTPTQAVNLTVVQSDKTPVKPEDLPEPIKNVLKSDGFAGWEVESAFLVSGDGADYYEINLIKGADKQSMKFDKDGNVL
ncbi:hypothetical protein LAG90_13565 [Marinilongibacter aquaticus]|uniref:hypothetical protein n=1 Tax=Marinilongibacter aquaticus TaxID=2975157 RepID=UPI0021BCFC1A|nr:hypothetical protein [Marinilongibacter aquaticus]UBM57833.1 hypothetical protein LAG90_13565 [Marinilongibacter aquaticus]